MKKFFFLIFFLINFTHSHAEENIVYIDINKIINESKVGISLNEQLKKINDKNIKEFKTAEASLKSEEENILKQKNILKEEEFNIKVNKLRERYKSYQEIKMTKNNELIKLRDNSGNQILKIINEILAEYSTKNKISLIMEKKNVVIGKSELDITKNILDLLNTKIKKVELKYEW